MLGVSLTKQLPAQVSARSAKSKIAVWQCNWGLHGTPAALPAELLPAPSLSVQLTAGTAVVQSSEFKVGHPLPELGFLGGKFGRGP